MHVNHMLQQAHTCVYLFRECLRGTLVCMYATCMQDVAYKGLCVQVDHVSLVDFRNLKKSGIQTRWYREVPFPWPVGLNLYNFNFFF